MSVSFRAMGSHGLLLEFSETTGSETTRAIRALDQAIARHPFQGLAEVVPGLVSLMVVFDPLVTDHTQVRGHLLPLMDLPPTQELAGQHHILPICYEAEFAPDLGTIAEQTGLSAEAVIKAHLASPLEVSIYGFAPGYAYLLGLDARLHLDRKPRPKRDVPAGSVIIAGGQCLITTVTMPTGWWILGRCPTPILTGDRQRPFLFDVGDKVGFRRISREELKGNSA